MPQNRLCGGGVEVGGVRFGLLGGASSIGTLDFASSAPGNVPAPGLETGATFGLLGSVFSVRALGFASSAPGSLLRTAPGEGADSAGQLGQRLREVSVDSVLLCSCVSLLTAQHKAIFTLLVYRLKWQREEARSEPFLLNRFATLIVL
jgi:hypothetical protein